MIFNSIICVSYKDLNEISQIGGGELADYSRTVALVLISLIFLIYLLTHVRFLNDLLNVYIHLGFWNVCISVNL